ncbi:hypothetical protein BDV59DRAFT_45072 [Aspergillus ambiguus]|uniref:uncharacterized protein n=1 Tax=Aspergillus ambiguus TaxID=176160 RepID=UPI003CCCCC3A
MPPPPPRLSKAIRQRSRRRSFLIPHRLVSHRFAQSTRSRRDRHVDYGLYSYPLGTGVPGIGPAGGAGRRSGRMAWASQRMPRTGVSDQDGLFLHAVAALAVGLTRVYRVFEVEAAADGESLDEFVAHCRDCFRCWGQGAWDGTASGWMGLGRMGW